MTAEATPSVAEGRTRGAPGSRLRRGARRWPCPSAPLPRSRLVALCLLVATALGATACEPAAERSAEPETPLPPVVANVSVDRAVATTGDLITYRVELDYDPSYEVELPEPGAEIAGFRIVDLGRERPREVEGRLVEKRWYELRADLVGSYVLPPIAVSYRLRAEDPDLEPGERASDTLTTSEIFVEVESVLPADGGAEDIRDIKPLRSIREPFPWPWWIGGGTVLLLSGLLGALFWRRRSRRPLAPPAPPHEVAFAALDRLRQTDFADPEAVRRYYFAISEVVRAYVEGRFGLNATDLTTEEILARLREVEGLGESDASSLASFLTATDQVKFAARVPTEEEIESTYEEALGFVERTRPRPQAEMPTEPSAPPQEKAA